MIEALLRFYAWELTTKRRVGAALRSAYDERGEGVISAAIAVLIMAFLGVAVWVGFRATLDSTQEKVDNQIEQIGE